VKEWAGGKEGWGAGPDLDGVEERGLGGGAAGFNRGGRREGQFEIK